ncbi:MAG: hypothetical protein QF790_11045, partial [Gammaproteobacteria bacterium]|nr:hypothetical protein [Gammaproteobacteria bacterium]
EIAVMARKSAPEPDHRLAVNALEAWEAGARPAANVWLAGIEALLDAGETALADAEFDKLLTVYPESAGEPGSGIRTRANLADGYAASELQEQEDADAAVLDEIIVINPADELADPQVWAAGIERLMETDENALAITEIAKFRQIYPDYEL